MTMFGCCIVNVERYVFIRSRHSQGTQKRWRERKHTIRIIPECFALCRFHYLVYILKAFLVETIVSAIQTQTHHQWKIQEKKNSSDIDSTWHSSSHSFIHEIYIYMCTTLIMFPIIFVKIPMFVRPKIHIPIIGHNLVFYYARGAFVLWFIQTFWMDAQMLSRAVNRLRSSLAVNAIVVVGITQLCQYFWVSTLTRLVRWKKQAIFDQKKCICACLVQFGYMKSPVSG